jgi:plastocyanin
MTKLATLILVAATAACSSSTTKADAPKGSGSDATGGASTVNVVANCTGVAAADIATTITTDNTNNVFTPATATITHGQYVKFTTTGDHNFQNQPGAASTSTFNSGSPGAQTACLQFTAAGSFPFECVVHASIGMLGTLTVN